MVPALPAYRPPPPLQQPSHYQYHRHHYQYESAKPPGPPVAAAAFPRPPAPVITGQDNIFCPYNSPFPDPFLHGEDKFVAALPARDKIPRENWFSRSQIRPGWHEDAGRVGGLYNDSSIFVKHRKHGCISLLYERQLRQRGSHGYSLTLVDGHISASDGVGFVFAGRVPCSKNIKRLWSVFANRAGHVVKRMGPRLIRSETAVLPPLTVGMTVSMVVDLNQYCATFEASVPGGKERHVLGRYHIDFTDIAERVDCSQGYLCAAVTRAGIAAHLDSFSPEVLELPAVPAIFGKRPTLMCKQALAAMAKKEPLSANAAASFQAAPSTYLPAFSSASTIFPQDSDCPPPTPPTDVTPAHWPRTAAAAAPQIVVSLPASDEKTAAVADNGDALPVDDASAAPAVTAARKSDTVPERAEISSLTIADQITVDASKRAAESSYRAAALSSSAAPSWPLMHLDAAAGAESTSLDNGLVPGSPTPAAASSCCCSCASSSETRLVAAHSTAAESPFAAALLAAGRAFSEPSAIHNYGHGSCGGGGNEPLGTPLLQSRDPFAAAAAAAAAGADVLTTTALLLQQQQQCAELSAFSQLSADGSQWDSQSLLAGEDSTNALAAAFGGGPLQRQLLEELFALQQLSQRDSSMGSFGAAASRAPMALTSTLERSETYYHGERNDSTAANRLCPPSVAAAYQQDASLLSPLFNGGGSVDVGCLSRYHHHELVNYHPLAGSDNRTSSVFSNAGVFDDICSQRQQQQQFEF